MLGLVATTATLIMIGIHDMFATDGDWNIEQGFYPCSRIVVSVAVLPPRWNGFERHVLPTLMELKGVDEIFVHIQGRVNSTSPSPGIRFFMHEDGVDMGPASKLLRTLPLELDPQSCIVTVDDDTVYSDPDMAMRLRDQIQRVPSGAVGNSCEEASAFMAFLHSISSWFLWWDVKNSDHAWKFPFSPPLVHCRGWLQGCEGVLYRRSDFADARGVPANSPPQCFFTDDVLISGYLHVHGVPRYVLLGSPHPRHLPKNRSNALSMGVGNVMEDRQWPCVEHYFFPRAPCTHARHRS
mmetsp:Transcript_74125/g.197639  ORF Transcript_74125/g.197639 Transcript_74125/m.197639 type:complete len:295 (-) Transcript_74125:85-969(-)